MPTFKVLRGVHSESNHDDGRPCMYGPGQPDGDVVESASDLDKYNLPGVPPRFERLPDKPRPGRPRTKHDSEASSSD